MHVIVSDKSVPSCWAATFIYGCPLRSGRNLVWESIRNIARSERLPWLCMGDFNQVIDCGLVDLEFKGPQFTWRNNRYGDNFIMERIDMAFANAQWRELHDRAMVFVEAAIGSDSPLVLNTEEPLNKNGEGSKMYTVCKKLRGCKEKLKAWSIRKFGNLKLMIATTKDQLMEVQKQIQNGFNPDALALEKSLIKKLEDLWQKNAMYWHQRSRIKWLQMGDKNSRFFHLSTIQRRQRNQIMRLKDSSGVWKSEHKEIAEIIKLHFQDLAVTREEVQLAAFQLGPLKAPGSDGFPGLFYQSYWDIVGEEVFEAVQNFFQEGYLLKEMNQTNVTLIPKRPNPEGMNHLRPISLCRFIYKIISKVLANRLQPFIGNIISEHQSAFIPGRQVQDNIIVAHEVFHYIKHKKKGPKASVALKLDLNKAYDRVCWDFLFQVMEKMGFDRRWINWVQQCVCTVKYSFMANGKQVCSINPGRGLRQGDPLSPYLFLLVADVFSTLLQKALLKKSIGGIRMKKRCPVMTHLLFADDSLVFLEAVPQYCSNFMELISCFSEASGLSLNVQKSSLFFTPNIKDSLKEEIKEILGMVEMDGDAKYLGLPLFWGKSKKESLGYIRDKIMKKIQGWGNKELNHAGKDVLIKSVLQPIPMYTFMCFKVPQSLCSCLNSAISNFWWGRSDTGNKIHWGAWQKLTDQKGMGGMGFKDFESFNVALLAKQFWHLTKEPNSLWARVLKGLYFPKKECIEAARGSTPSWI
ncbi:hypothetical protein RHGRI_027682 [Rhododendron griersonianum]|uniref:Reverse transcriptase domain-containing protein n=1 Tax=Rhododendron griersonianum TaxID=479676 RepID=A0AAV6IXN8_9ERIC|nr:hypothetical protein RHGRI_027682 [Rhododendron griersonianum]